jgi:DNA-binding LytR/AlgR family response regulator
LITGKNKPGPEVKDKRIPMPNETIYHFNNISKRYFKTYLGLSISVFLFILYFQPFTTNRFEFENKILYIAGFGIIIFIIQVIVQIIFQSILIRDENEREENSLLNALYYFSLLSLSTVAITFYIRYVGHTAVTFNLVVRVVILCLSIPVTIHLKNKLESIHGKYKNLLHENRLMEDKLKQFTGYYSNRFIELSSDNDSNNIKILLSELVFIKSADNYVEVGFLDGGEFKKKMIRNTLKNIEQQLKEFNNFIRTHRSSIVNMKYILKLNKNFNTYWLTLDETKETIPVSRQYLMAVKDLL